MSRYNSRDTALNTSEKYEKLFDRRDIKRVIQYRTPILNFPDLEQQQTINVLSHYWLSTDKFYKLANQYYGDHTLWWVIAQYNQKPTEQHISPGEAILIPSPISIVLQYVS